MRLVSVYDNASRHIVLWELLQERDIETVGISHKKMPTMEEHIKFVDSMPYRAWWFIHGDHGIAGSIYLTEEYEIGVFIFKSAQRCGYATEAIKWVLEHRPDVKRFLANINPRNIRSIALFRKLGFSLLQETYAYEPDFRSSRTRIYEGSDDSEDVETRPG